jgi:hypothetical protein
VQQTDRQQRGEARHPEQAHGDHCGETRADGEHLSARSREIREAPAQRPRDEPDSRAGSEEHAELLEAQAALLKNAGMNGEETPKAPYKDA